MTTRLPTGPSAIHVPAEFQDAVTRALRSHCDGDLRLLSYEAVGFPWSSDGLRAIGRAQFSIGATSGAIETFQRLREEAPDDAETQAALLVVRPAVAAKHAVARVLVFTGHRVDDEGRARPRFPRTAAAEAEARRMIRDAVAEEQRGTGAGDLVGVAGGACGGDILFLEVCAELGIRTELLLALPRREFARESVEGGGADWMQRYDELCDRLKPRVMTEALGGDAESLPAWLRGKKDYGVWQRNNLWILFNALAIDAPDLTLIALWDGGPADGPGGTSDLVKQVTDRDQKVVRLPAEQLKALL